MIPFLEASYQAQVFRLRSLAVEALRSYPFKVTSLDFIHHGENATFKVTARLRGRLEKFLLRIHRAEYHTREALLEELDWISVIGAPRPVASRSGELLVSAFVEGLDRSRFCSVLEWTEGRRIYKGVKPLHIEMVGRKLAEIQESGSTRKVKHRRYWTADGLLGSESTFGGTQSLLDVSRAEQARITGAARELHSELASYSKREPRKRGLIHADMHFGNAIFTSDGGLTAIDFDDCGYGFYLYDLAVPLVNVEGLLKDDKSLDYDELLAALIEGYGSLKTVTASDLKMIELFKVARRIAMVGWMNARVSNPRLRKHLRGSIERALLAIKTIK